MIKDAIKFDQESNGEPLMGLAQFSLKKMQQNKVARAESMTEKKDHLRILRAIHNKNLSLPQGELDGTDSLNSRAITPLKEERELVGGLSSQDMVILPNYNN